MWHRIIVNRRDNERRFYQACITPNLHKVKTNNSDKKTTFVN